jgi:hypothetical protein
MGVSPAVFQSAGQRSEHYVPGAYSRSAAIGGGGGISAGNGVILGKSVMGAPGVLNVFSTVSEAKDVLGDGELLKAVAHAFNPSPEYSPQRIHAMVVNGNTQGTRVLKSGAAEILKLKSSMYGTPANRLKMRLSNGTNPGTKKAAFEQEENSQSVDNIGKESIRLQYTGSGSAAVLDINNVGLSVEVTQNGAAPALDFQGLNGLRTGETKEFNVAITNPEGADVYVMAKVEVSGVDPALLEFKYFETGGGQNAWLPFPLNEPFGMFGGADDFPLANASVQFSLKPLAGAEESILEYKIKLLQVIGGAVSTNVIAETTIGKIEIVAAGRPYSGYNIPAYDANSGSLFLAFEDFPTIENIVSRLNAAGEFAVIQLETEPNIASAELDAVSALDIKSDAQTLKSDFYALFHALENAVYAGAGNVEKIEGAQNVMPDNDADFVYFEGASAGTYTVEDWNNALIALEAENIQIISTPSTDQAVHTLISNHCTSMSNVVNRKERTFFAGGPIGETLARAIERAAALNTKLGSYIYPAINANSPLTGSPEDLPASYLACKLLGMECAVAVNEPLTWKNVSVNKFLVKLKTTEMEKLIIGGVLCGGTTDDNRLAVIRAMTTYQGNQLQLVERSMVREDLYMNRDIRNRFSTGVGRPGVDKGNSAKETLLGAARGWKGEGLIIPTDDGENVWGITVSKSGDKTYITFSRNLTAPQNFFFITANNYVYESATTVEV